MDYTHNLEYIHINKTIHYITIEYHMNILKIHFQLCKLLNLLNFLNHLNN